MKVLVTGGAGFVGSHVSEYYARKGDEVVVFDNLMRFDLLGYDAPYKDYNWNHLKAYDSIEMIKGDIRDEVTLREAAKDCDIIIHTAAQTAVTTSLVDPRTDFEVNALGTFNVLEAARTSKSNPCVIFCSTNKVYGNNVNAVSVKNVGDRYLFDDPKYEEGISEDFPIDHCEHTPYGSSKLSADIYIQDYAQRSEIDAAIFRMSCIYGPRQFGVEDQGWVAWFIIAALTGKPITIYGDGKQVRDILYVTDLVRAFDLFISRRDDIHHGIYNTGGGSMNTISLLELLKVIRDGGDVNPSISFEDWRPSDQKVYVSNIEKLKDELCWTPIVDKKSGIIRLMAWVAENRRLFC